MYLILRRLPVELLPCIYIVIRDRKNRRVIIIEAKKANREEEMEKMCLARNAFSMEQSTMEGKRPAAKQAASQGMPVIIRKYQEPDGTIEIPAPEEFEDFVL